MSHADEYEELIEFVTKEKERADSSDMKDSNRIRLYHMIRGELWNSLEGRVRKDMEMSSIASDGQDAISQEYKKIISSEPKRAIKDIPMWGITNSLKACSPKQFKHTLNRLEQQRQIRNWYSHDRFNKEKQGKLLGHTDEVDLTTVERLYEEMLDVYMYFEKYVFNRNRSIK